MKIFRSLFVCVILVGLASCDVPHLNPLDPQNPDYSFGQIDGYVYSRPRDPLPKAKVTLKQQNISVETDSQGYYKIDGAKITDGIVFIEKEGLKKDSIRVLWNKQKSIRLEGKILDYTMGQIDGTVRAIAPSLKALSGVKVFWKNQNILITTDSQGNFSFNNIPYNNGWMFFEIEGYSKDSLFVELNSYVEKIKHLNNIYLNSIPLLNSLFIYAGVENRYQDDQKDTLYVQANISDAENDIDSVNVRSTSLNLNKKLKFNTKKNVYELIYFYGTKNSIPPIDDAIGKSFEIIVKDRLGKTFNIGLSTIKRVIRQEILFESPANGVIVSPKPVYRWYRFLPGFNFKYMMQIFTNENTPQLKWEKSDISKDDIEIIPNINLTPGDYYWVIWCIDDFQNRARSKPATFNVQ